MEKLQLTYMGTDDWSRPVFKSEEGRFFKDLNCGDGQLDLCTSNSFDGEPITPIHDIENYKNVEFVILGMEEHPTPEEKFNYMMLGRLQSDCEYYLGFGGRNEKRLWAGNVSEQIAKMKEIYSSFNDDKKPEWITMDDILSYENKMTQ